MVCPKCGNVNRSGARFCKKCGAVLEQVAPSPPPRVAPSPPLPVTPPPVASPPPPMPAARPFVPPVAPPPPAPAAPSIAPPPATDAARSGGVGRVIGGIGLFGGYLLAIFGALGTLGAFFLPWFPAGEKMLTGFDTVSKAFEAGGDQMFLAWGLAPLGALGVVLLGLLGLVMGLFRKRLSPGMARITLLLPLLVILSGVCGCFPFSSPLIAPLIQSNFDVNSLGGGLASLGYGFWVALAGVGVSLVGVLIALVGGLMGRPRAAS
ncbi:MAG: zinc ribbon domain-containing protein [Anaerolineae bacterium]|nr:zinc ribbon domain-containing protein [Anaerolineae bacterium]